MSINIGPPAVEELRPRITVIGIGGAGGNAHSNMINAEIEGVDFTVAKPHTLGSGLDVCEFLIARQKRADRTVDPVEHLVLRRRDQHFERGIGDVDLKPARFIDSYAFGNPEGRARSVVSDDSTVREARRFKSTFHTSRCTPCIDLVSKSVGCVLRGLRSAQRV